eukprot:g3075.t1
MDAEHPCKCCFYCAARPGCYAWVFREDTKRCYFKHATYESCKKIPCASCTASRPQGSIHYYNCTKIVSQVERWTSTEVEESESYSSPESSPEPSPSPESSPEPSASPGVSQTSTKMASLAELKESAGDSKYGKGVYIGNSTEPSQCSFSEGFDQPAKFDLLKEPLILTTSYDCCHACMQNSMCKSWVWKRDVFECFLKKHYDESHSISGCTSCIAYSSSSFQYVYIKTAKQESSEEYEAEELYKEESEGSSGSYPSASKGESECRGTRKRRKKCSSPSTEGSTESSVTTHKFGGGIAKASDGERCAFIEGYDIPAAFNLLPKPLNLAAAYMCCNACKQNDQCKSWVWKKTSHDCYLKNNYDYRRAKEILCEDCISYSSFGAYYVYRLTTSTATTYTESSEKYAPTEQEGSESSSTSHKYGGGIAKASDGERCAFIEGYDIPAAFNMLPKPLNLATAYMCCNACKQNDQCRSWVWKTTSHDCYLKNNYDYRRAKEILCEDCISYSSFGAYYVYELTTSTTTPMTAEETSIKEEPSIAEETTKEESSRKFKRRRRGKQPSTAAKTSDPSPSPLTIASSPSISEQTVESSDPPQQTHLSSPSPSLHPQKHEDFSSKKEADETTTRETVECPYITKFDQPTKYDLFYKPLILNDVEDCCVKCHHNPSPHRHLFCSEENQIYLHKTGDDVEL